MSTDPKQSVIAEQAKAKQALDGLVADKMTELRLPNNRTSRRAATRAVRKDIARWKRDTQAVESAGSLA